LEPVGAFDLQEKRLAACQPYTEDTQNDDTRFRYRFGPIQSIATSTGRNDAGLFEVAFRDERYLPFEGAGAISRWRIELPRETNAFDVDTLSDVVIHLPTRLATEARC
jgi:receptor-binding and translocation channel-forming TcA subunit of Tc toxin